MKISITWSIEVAGSNMTGSCKDVSLEEYQSMMKAIEATITIIGKYPKATDECNPADQIKPVN